MSEYEYRAEDMRRAPPVVIGTFPTHESAVRCALALGVPHADVLVTTVPTDERLQRGQREYDRLAGHYQSAQSTISELRAQIAAAEKERVTAKDSSKSLSVAVEKITNLTEEVRLGRRSAADAIASIDAIATEVL